MFSYKEFVQSYTVKIRDFKKITFSSFEQSLMRIKLSKPEEEAKDLLEIIDKLNKRKNSVVGKFLSLEGTVLGKLIGQLISQQ
jgi:hypothetical protein